MAGASCPIIFNPRSKSISMYFFEMNETPKNIIQTGHFVTGKTPQPKIETPPHVDVSGEENSQNTSLVAGDTSISMENPNKTTSGKTAASISLSTSTVQASDVNGDDGSTLAAHSRRRRTGRPAKANTGKKPPHPHNQLKGQLPQKTCGRIESSYLCKKLPSQALSKASVNRGAGMAQWWEHSSPSPPVLPGVRFPDSASYVSWVCCWFSSLLQEVFLRILWFSPPLKNLHF